MSPRGTNVLRVAALVRDFAEGIDGQPQGLTLSELARAWRARHGSDMPRKAVESLSQELCIRQGMKRQCTVQGIRVRPWLPVV